MNNKIVEIQNTIFNQIKRLDDNRIMDAIGKEEIARANAISNASTSYIKSVNLQLAILSTAERINKEYTIMQRELGICEEE